MSITGHMIARSEKAIIGVDHTIVKTGELTAAGAEMPAHLVISGNRVS